MGKPSGYLIHAGASPFNGAPIVAILTLENTNRALGDPTMRQLWIGPDFREGRLQANSWSALRARGLEASVCGECNLRPSREGGCYVSGQPLTSISGAIRRERYPELEVDSPEVRAALFGHELRFGAWGDPAMVPAEKIAALAYSARRWIGYTHQWRQPWAQEHRSFCMASIDHTDPPGSLELAWSMGWSTYRERRPGDPVIRGEARCPKSLEAGGKRSCSSCPFGCAGASSRSATIIDHGPKSEARRARMRGNA